jgi:hypothetical protein
MKEVIKRAGILLFASVILTACGNSDLDLAQSCAEKQIQSLMAQYETSIIYAKATNIRPIKGKDLIILDIESEILFNESGVVQKLPISNFKCFTTETSYNAFQERKAEKEAAREAETERRARKIAKEKSIREAQIAEERARIANERAIRDAKLEADKSVRKAEELRLAKIATEAKKSAGKKVRIAQLEVERLKAAERVTKEKERKEKKIEKERILAEFTPLLPQCVKNDYSRLKNKLNVAFKYR